MEKKLDLILNKLEKLDVLEAELKETRQELKETRQELKEFKKETRQELKETRQELKEFKEEAKEGFDAVLTALQAHDGRLVRAEKKLDRVKVRLDINTGTIKENALRIEDLELSFQPEEA